MECVTEDVILVHMEKFQELKQIVNFFACLRITETHPEEFLLPCFLFLLPLAFTWISLELTYGQLKKQTKNPSYSTQADLFW